MSNKKNQNKHSDDILIDEFLESSFVEILCREIPAIMDKCENVTAKSKQERTELSSKENVLVEAFLIYMGIDKCLKNIEYSRRFVLHYGYNDWIRKDAVAFDDFCLYHYDVICHKVSTIKDLYFNPHCRRSQP